ncbi:MAG: exodeoxyribonuclease VII small subunit [Saprospiraceae bacterium]|nr:exodeoxyribonuclease VII small subunit [Saprospiraceae bacterium]
MNDETTPLSYASAWAELQQILRAVQEETIEIDELAGRLERAEYLIRFCREKLRQTGQALDQLEQQTL